MSTSFYMDTSFTTHGQCESPWFIERLLYISKSQYEYWKHTQLIIDVIEGSGGTFSLEGATGKAFHTRSRVFTPQELEDLNKNGL